jgi:plasmid maintenance system killer protein
MILRFGHRRLSGCIHRGDTSGVSVQHVKRLRAVLAALETASAPSDMALPGARLHPLRGDRAGQWVGIDLRQLACDLRIRGSVRHHCRFGRLPLNRKEVREPMARLHNPPHPGEVIKEMCLDPLKLTVTAAAEGLGVSRRTLSMLLNGHAGVPPIWPFGSRKRSGARRKAGCSCSCNTICGRLSNDPTRSR